MHCNIGSETFTKSREVLTLTERCQNLCQRLQLYCQKSLARELKELHAMRMTDCRRWSVHGLPLLASGAEPDSQLSVNATCMS